MKKLVYFTIIFSFFTSCELMEIQPETVLTTDNFWITEDDARAGVNSIYAPILDAYKKYFLFWFEARSDNWYTSVGTTDASNVQEVALNNISSSMKPADWNDFYYAISRANYALYFLPTMKIAENTKNHLIAESHFLRAKCYFDIVRLWGDAPLITKPTLSLQDVDYPVRMDKDSILAQIKFDIQQSLLLADKSKNDKFLFTYAAALTLASHYYMWMHDYENAEAATLEIINTKLFKLVPSEEWPKMLNQGDLDENIWTLDFSYANNGTNTYITYMCYNKPAVYISEPLRQRWQNASSLNEDARFEQTTNTNARAPYPYNHLTTPYNASGIYKFSLQQYVPNVGVEIPIIVFRYAEILLLRAEALVKLDRLKDAVDLLNQVHNRSVQNNSYLLADFQSQTDPAGAIEEAILNERQIELLGEGYRWFDLIRTGKHKDVMNDFFVNYIAVKSNLKYRLFESNDDLRKYFPVLKDNIIDNSNLNQTLGY